MDPAITSRREFIDRFTALCAADDRVAAVFLSGSYAAGNPDPFSDVDLKVVAADGAYDQVFADRWKILSELGELVLAVDFDGFGRDMLLYLYADGVDGEVDLHPRDAVSWADPSRLVPLVDKDQVAADVHAWPTPTTATRKQRAERLVQHFWRHVWLGSAALARGRLLTAYACLDAARVCCVNLARLRHDLTAKWLTGYDKAEDVLTRSEVADLASTFGPLERRAMTAAWANLIDLFESLAEELWARHDLVECTRLAAVVKQRFGEVS